MNEISIVRENLMTGPNYTPYCGNWDCGTMSRTKFIFNQFVCPHCGWQSKFPDDFIQRYKTKWNL